ncbi:adenylate cyclase [Nocardioides thalensis]|uniref:Adenylate cyclase n=1 Tax=Nocardioides thalensis TaxID=1914755 RepID=A0A853C6S3_9ACTN|nr:adenylate cyclase [Nocardioides thalensis]
MSDEAPSLTAAEVAERAGMPVDQARRLWRILGFPESGDAPAFSKDDVVALETVMAVLRDGIVDLDVIYNVARGVGLTMARLADWEVSTLVQHVEEAYAAAGGSPDGDPATWAIDKYGKAFEDLIIHAWRRHLSASLARMESVRAVDEEAGTVQVTVGFADIVGFTALSNELTRERIGDLVELFEARCGDVIAAQHGRLIKSMGDAVLFVNDDPLAAFATAEGIINVIGRDSRMPDVRVGLATGAVVMRLGDVFGPPVNLASRLTNVARRNRIIIDAATADLLPGDQIESRPLPPRPVRGFGIVEPLTARRV